MFIHKPHNKVHILWWGSSQSAHSAHSNPMTRARKEALELDSLADSGLQLLQTDWSSSSRLLLINPKLTSYIYAFLHCLLHIPWRLPEADPAWPPMPYLECNLLLPRSWSTPLAIEALLICRPPSSLLPAVRATRSGSPHGGSCPFGSLRSRSACPSLPPRLFFSFPTTVSPSPLLLYPHSNGSSGGSEVWRNTPTTTDPAPLSWRHLPGSCKSREP